MNKEIISEKYWDEKYIIAKEQNSSPGWEAKEVFHALRDYINKDGFYKKINDFNPNEKLRIIELGCGASNSSIWLAEQGHDVTAIDFSSEAIKRAKDFDKKCLVNWVVGDLLNDNFFDDYKIEKNYYDFILDMQCYHCLRLIDEDKYLNLLNNLMKKDSVLMLVVGAYTEPYFNGRINDKIYNNSGPNLLEVDDFLFSFNKLGFTLQSLKLSKFNESINNNSYSCWVAIFKKP